MKPEYRLRLDEVGNVLFLDYTTKHGPNYALYDLRWVWTQKLEGHEGEWYLVPFPHHHNKALMMLSEEIELAKRAFEDIKAGKIKTPTMIKNPPRMPIRPSDRKPVAEVKMCPMCRMPVQFKGVEDGEEILECKCGLCNERKPEIKN